MKAMPSTLTMVTLSALLCSLFGCEGSSGGNGSASPTATVAPQTTFTPTATPTNNGQLDIAICAPGAGPFSAAIDNPFFPISVGTQWVLEGANDEGAAVRLVITALEDTELVAGVTTRVLEEREWEDDALIEVSRNFFVQTQDGTVCYYGEDVDIYEDDEIVSHEGAWRAGVNGALPGIVMPASPRVGQRFKQELAPGVAEDEAELVSAGNSVTVGLGTFTDTIEFEESSPLDGGTSHKVYARDVGLLIDEEVERVAP